MKNHVTCFSAAAVLALVLVTSQNASAQATIITDIPLNVVLYNDCTGENISLAGSLTLVSNVVTDGTGTMHGTFFFSGKDIVGTGDTNGDSYKMRTGSHLSMQLDPILPNTVQTANGFFNLIGPGGLSVMLHYLAHVVVDSNGDVTAFTSHFLFKCS